MPARIRVPASSANLGPGFDTLGLALSCYLACEVSAANELAITASGRDAGDIPQNDSNLIWQTALGVAERASRPLPPAHLRVDNDIPLGKGLGSSAAALVAGVLVANELCGLGWNRRRVLQEAAQIEGHPDNVAASVLGSVIAAAIDGDGHACAVRLPWPAAVQVSVLVPDFALPTHHARAVLPVCYSKADSIFNVQRASLLVAALATNDASALSIALEDRFHQPYREPLVPGLKEALHLRVPGLVGCTLSGAGPSVLIFYRTGQREVCQTVHQTFTEKGGQAELMHLAVDSSGYTLSSESVIS